MNFNLPKAERLNHKKKIEALFDRKDKNNLSKSSFPFMVVYRISEEEITEFPQILVSVSKRKFKRAVDRNLIKRRTKEAYRVNKAALQGKKVEFLAFIYISKNIETFELIEKGMKKSLHF